MKAPFAQFTLAAPHGVSGSLARWGHEGSEIPLRGQELPEAPCHRSRAADKKPGDGYDALKPGFIHSQYSSSTIPPTLYL